jgi:hypothetical protein
VTAFYIARHILPTMCSENDRHEQVQMARLVLGAVVHPMPSWHPQAGTSEVHGFRYPLWLGQHLRRGLVTAVA